MTASLRTRKSDKLRMHGFPDLTVPSWTLELPPLPSFDSVTYESLYQSGDSFNQAINRLTSDKVVLLPSGFDELIDGFGGHPNGYGAFSPNLLGLVGTARSQTRLMLKPLSSTQAQRDRIPAQNVGGSNPLTILRIGMGRGKNILAQMTIEGTDQEPLAINDGMPHNYSGVNLFQWTDGLVQDVLLKSASAGNYHYPPGETFEMNDYKGLRTTFRALEVDGVTRAGRRASGSPLGGNNSIDILLEDCYLHDTLVSGLTYSYTGTHTNAAAATRGVTTRRCRIRDNANWSNVTGRRFGAINHENVYGPIRHEYLNIHMANLYNWNSGHIAFAHWFEDVTDITILEPNWNKQSAPRNNGMFTIAIPTNFNGESNKQVTVPKVIKNGIELIPVHIYSGPNSNLTQSPDTHFVVVH